MGNGIKALGLLFAASSAFAGFDNQIIKSEEASRILLAGRIGEAAFHAVQLDTDSDMELFATASSQLSDKNDHWIILDWNSDQNEYQIVESVSLKSPLFSQESAINDSFKLPSGEILLGHEDGQLTTIQLSPSDDADSQKATLTFQSKALTDNPIRSILQIESTLQEKVTVVCSDTSIGVLTEAYEITNSVQDGGYCQSGDIDTNILNADTALRDQELVVSSGHYYTYDGTAWNQKAHLSGVLFGSNFLVANIDDDLTDEILLQEGPGQVQVYSPGSNSSQVYVSALQNARSQFNAIDIDDDGIFEVVFNHTVKGTEEDEPDKHYIDLVKWDDAKDTHTIIGSIDSPYQEITPLKFVPTTITENKETDFKLFFSNLSKNTKDLSTKLLYNMEGQVFGTNTTSSIFSTANGTFQIVQKVGAGNSLSDYSAAQLIHSEDIDDAKVNLYPIENLDFVERKTLNILNAQFTKISTLTAFDSNLNGIEELHVTGKGMMDHPDGTSDPIEAGKAVSIASNGIIDRLINTWFIEDITQILAGNLDNIDGTDYFVTGKNIGDDNGGIGYQFLYDSGLNSSGWFNPGTGDTDFKALVASNIKGDSNIEILGLHSQLSAYDPAARSNESSFYNLNNLNISTFTPIQLLNRDYEYIVSADTLGQVHLIEPKDFDILTSSGGCNASIDYLTTILLNNNLNVVLSLCNSELMSWAIEYNPDNEDGGYTLHPLAASQLSITDTTDIKLVSLSLDEGVSLLALTPNKYIRWNLNSDIGVDQDNDNLVNYKDQFPEDETQWEDGDQDGLGDNPTGNNPDPSLNDIDNDGVIDSEDPDNEPSNDLDSSNDSDNGYPYFINQEGEKIESDTFPTISESGNTDNVVLLETPIGFDFYDNNIGKLEPVVSASQGGHELSKNSDGKFYLNRHPGTHEIVWTATDRAGNSTSVRQFVNIYPTIYFAASAIRQEESQNIDVTVQLSGESPVYPFTVTLESLADSNTNTASLADIQSLESETIIAFEAGEVSKTVTFNLVDDSQLENQEKLTLKIKNTFNAENSDNKWTVLDERDEFIISIADRNLPPTGKLNVTQLGVVSTESVFNNVDSPTVFSLEINDPNVNDKHIITWNLEDMGLGVATQPSVAFDPANIQVGTYMISAQITDDAILSETVDVQFVVTVVYGDTDKDGYTDDIDKFKTNPTQWEDNDGDGLGDNQNGTDSDPYLNDFDNDGVTDDLDAFKTDNTQWEDKDGDGLGDNPNGNNADPSINDFDNDGVTDDIDVFKDDKTQWEDKDGDGLGDNPNGLNPDPSINDFDNDGYTDDIDAFPKDPTEWRDYDKDGIGDNKDTSKLEDASGESGGSLYYFLIALLVLCSRRVIRR